MARLVVKCTWGAQRPEALFQAFTVAATAAASGVEVSLWLTGDATEFALPGTADVDLEYSPSLSKLRETILAAGTITVCTQCALRRGLEQSDLIQGIRIAGAATFVEEAMGEGTTALVY